MILKAPEKLTSDVSQVYRLFIDETNTYVILSLLKKFHNPNSRNCLVLHTWSLKQWL